ncbi:G-patch-domain-containing protein, partial [Neolentinus lepideus HHB14362 ss-1]
MSAESIARWNAIPLNRPYSGSPPLKRSRSDDGQSDQEDDSISLISRSPSPVDPMNVDQNIDKYDEYHRGTAREVITVETKLKSTNKGFAMLAKMGWAEGQGLGLSGEGRVDPIPFTVKNDSTGLGKVNQDFRMIETTVSQRRELDSERQTKESEEQRKAREDAAAKKAALQEEISTTLRAFYCELCDKQFKNVAQYDEHTNSYAHHHKARARDMQAAQKLMQGRGSKEDIDKRKEKERKREEKEMRKLAAAAGIKLAKPPALASASTAGADPAETSAGFKKSGWAAVSS